MTREPYMSWEEEYDLDGKWVGPILLPEDPIFKRELQHLLDTGNHPSKALLLSSQTGGTGKTSFVERLKKSGHYDDFFEFNGRDANIERMRKLKGISETVNFYRYLVIVNEASNATPDFLEEMKILTDKMKNTKFVFTDNHGSDLARKYPPLFSNSRMIQYNFQKTSKADFEAILQEILADKGIETGKGIGQVDLEGIVRSRHPDLRGAIKEMERDFLIV